MPTVGFNPPLLGPELSLAFPDLNNFSPIGAGGQGTVYSCTDITGTQLALKIYIPSAGFGQEERIAREIQKLSSINHRNVVRLFRSGSASIRNSTYLYSLTELIDGVELKRSTLPISNTELKNLLIDTASGIEALWALRTVHRDIKPDNLLRRPDGSWVLIDLGIAKHLGEQTITGGWIGTPGFMSPEQFSARKTISYYSDLYSLGIVAYLAATNRHPFDFNQHNIGQITPPAPINHNASLNSNISTSIMRLLKPRPIDRSPKLSILIQQLKAL